MKARPLQCCGTECERCGRNTMKVVMVVLLVGVLLASFVQAAPPDACIQGYVWREAYPGDPVCVAPAVRDQAAADNKLAASRREPRGGAYGPDTCKSGFVWREARPQDHVCVTPDVRAQTAHDNSHAHARRATPPAAANGGSMRESAPMAMPETITTRSARFKLPEFPWPPPPFSARLKLDRALLVAGQTAPTNGSVATRVEQALAANGYSQLSYYAVPEGFAIVTQIERIDSRAASAAEQRWSTEVPPAIPFNLDAYIKALLGKDGDSFRVIAFAFTPTPFTAGGRPVAPGAAMAWAEKGATALPAALAAEPYGSDTVCTALVYEFRISSLGAAAKRPGAFSGAQHLRAAGILKALERNP